MNQSRFDLELLDSGDATGTQEVKAIPTYRDPDYSYKVFYIEVETGMLVGADFFDGEEVVITSYSIHYTKLYDCHCNTGRYGYAAAGRCKTKR